MAMKASEMFQDQRFDTCKFCSKEVRRGEWHQHFPCDAYRASLKINADATTIKVGMTVTFKAINGEQFAGTVIELDRYGFAVVNLGMSESRIAVSELVVA